MQNVITFGLHVLVVSIVWNRTSPCWQLVVQGSMSSQTVTVLQRLVSLFGLTAMLKDLGDFLEDDYASRQQASLIRQQQYALLRELRPDAVALVDGFGFEDYLLNSSLGR